MHEKYYFLMPDLLWLALFKVNKLAKNMRNIPLITLCNPCDMQGGIKYWLGCLCIWRNVH